MSFFIAFFAFKNQKAAPFIILLPSSIKTKKSVPFQNVFYFSNSLSPSQISAMLFLRLSNRRVPFS